jgi:hypothetical protein
MTEQERKALEALDKLYEENGNAMTKLAKFEMTDEQQELYDIVADWWDEVFCNNPAPVDRDGEYLDKNPTIIDLVDAIIEWKDQDEYVEDPWNLQPRQSMQPVKKPQQHPVEGFE